ncbi:MAG: phosphoenolpyruvate synthase, partial [Firmicutes bacterium]|nr:phosphoenolpyruvate synthase [Bacillota bacterium]
MEQYVLAFSAIDRSSVAVVGSKGANLGELCRIPGIAVPTGFCVTTQAYQDFVHSSPQFASLLEGLNAIDAVSLAKLGAAGQQIRAHLAQLAIPMPIARQIIQAWQETGAQYDYAIRSSATAEDLPGASFAGQQDTFLNVAGEKNILNSVRQCWASLFTDRAIVYRQKNVFRHERVLLSVVVQRMVFPAVAGIMFTADPINGNRKIVSIDASFGLGEALVSGIVSADLYRVKSDRLVDKQIGKKTVAIYANPEGGTVRAEIPLVRQTMPALTEEQAISLAGIGRHIEQHFGCPQDIEWCLAENEIFIVQSRPITTLYPVPGTSDDKLHLFLSLGHVQMMTDAMRPLGISVLRTMVPLAKRAPEAEGDLLQEAGGRLYLDLTPLLEYRRLKNLLPRFLLLVDELMGRTVQEFISREELRTMTRSSKSIPFTLLLKALPIMLAVLANILYRNHDQVIGQLYLYFSETVARNRAKLQDLSGPESIAMVRNILNGLLPMFVAPLAQYMATVLLSYKLLENLSRKWVGDATELGFIAKSPPGNVTTEMGLSLGDLADTIRNFPAVIAYLEQATDETFWSGLKAVPGSEDVQAALEHFLKRYGMRGTGEIDITRMRWRETPTQLVPAILSHIKSVPPGQHRRDFLAGKAEAELATTKLLQRLRQKPFGWFKALCMQRL